MEQRQGRGLAVHCSMMGLTGRRSSLHHYADLGLDLDHSSLDFDHPGNMHPQHVHLADSRHRSGPADSLP